MNITPDNEYVIAYVLNLDGSVEKKKFNKSTLKFDINKYQDIYGEIYIYKDIDNKNRVCTEDTFYDLKELRNLPENDDFNTVSSDSLNNKKLGFMHSLFTYLAIPCLIVLFLVASIGTLYYMILEWIEYGPKALWSHITPFGLRLCMLFTSIDLMICFLKKSVSSPLAYKTFLYRYIILAVHTIIGNILYNDIGLIGTLILSAFSCPVPLFVWLYYKDRLNLLSIRKEESTIQFGTHSLLKLFIALSFVFFIWATFSIAGPKDLSFYLFIIVTFPITIIKNFMKLGFSTYYSSVTLSVIACYILYHLEYNTFERG